MKKKLILFTSAILLIATLSACSKTDEVSATNIATSDTSINIEQLQSDFSEIENKYNDITKIYDETLEASINEYCEKYLSYTGTATDNIEKVKDIVTDNYYDELQSQTGHQKSDEDYEQSTGVQKLYYENFSEPSDSIDVLAHCKQTVIYYDEVSTYNVFYTFEMKLKSDTWKINSVSNNS